MRNIKNIVICFLALLLYNCNPRTNKSDMQTFYENTYSICINEDFFWNDEAKKNDLGDWDNCDYLEGSLTYMEPTKAMVKYELNKIKSYFMQAVKNNSISEYKNSKNIRISLKKEFPYNFSNEHFLGILEDENILFLNYFKFDIIFKTSYGEKKYSNLIYCEFKCNGFQSLEYVIKDRNNYYMLVN